jgi:hypothetical protein
MVRSGGAVAAIVFISWCAPLNVAAGPDIITGQVQGPREGLPCPATWGPTLDGVYGFIGLVTACNIGNMTVPGVDPSIGSNQHPVQAHHLYQLKTITPTNPFERFQQIGIGWLKHDDWTGSDHYCGGSASCALSGGLSAGCSDTYGIVAQAYAQLGPRATSTRLPAIFPETIIFPHPGAALEMSAVPLRQPQTR